MSVSSFNTLNFHTMFFKATKKHTSKLLVTGKAGGRCSSVECSHASPGFLLRTSQNHPPFLSPMNRNAQSCNHAELC